MLLLSVDLFVGICTEICTELNSTLGICTGPKFNEQVAWAEQCVTVADGKCGVASIVFNPEG
jgi:hypothetical protein